MSNWVIQHTECPWCQSSDAYSVNSNGWGSCYSCNRSGKHKGDINELQSRPQMKTKAISEMQIDYKDIKSRRLSVDTCTKFKYGIGMSDKGPVQVARYYDASGNECARKYRTADKQFWSEGDMKSAQLFGQHLWPDGGKRIIITEGEVDALSMSQAMGNKWPVVSIKNGAASAKANLKEQLEWLQKFDEVILMFDNDEAGAKAAAECIELFKPGRLKVATLPLKDASDMLIAGRVEELTQAAWNAKALRPDGIIDAASLIDEILIEDVVVCDKYPWHGLNGITDGIRKQELVTITAGSGIGKSTIVREICHGLLGQGKKLGIIALEESVKRSVLGLLSISLGQPLHINRQGVSDEDIKSAFNDLIKDGNLFLYDHFGSTSTDNLLGKIRYFCKSLDCDYIILDHVSIVVSGLSDGDERRTIDNLMTELRTIVQETGVGMIIISHLRRPEGKGHEEGATTSLSQLRGSHSIAQLSDIVLGAERDQQGKDKNAVNIRVLKNRFNGKTGLAVQLNYNPITGRLKENSLAVLSNS